MLLSSAILAICDQISRVATVAILGRKVDDRDGEIRLVRAASGTLALRGTKRQKAAHDWFYDLEVRLCPNIIQFTVMKRSGVGT